MPIFPQINAAGLLTQRPYEVGLHYATTTTELPSGIRHGWGWRDMGLTNFPTKPLAKFDLNFMAITDDELAVIQTFFESMKGRYGEFSYLDPGGNLVPNSEDFDSGSWSGSFTGAATTDPFGGNRARTAGSGSMSCTFFPGTGANGFMFCASLWCRASSASGLTIAVTGADSSVRSLPVGSWVQVTHAGVTSSTGSLSVTYTLSGAGAVFGAQVVPMAGPGGYMRTPGATGYHAKCRFDTDQLSPRYLGPNQISLRLPIVETF